MIAVMGDLVDTGDVLWLGNPSQVVDTGIRAWSINNGAVGYLVYLSRPAQPGQRWQARVTLTCPTGDPASLFVSLLAVSASGTILDRWSTDPVLVTSAGIIFPIVTGPLPPGTATIRCQVDAASADGTNRTLTVYATLCLYAAADEVIQARLEQPVGNTVIDIPAGVAIARAGAGALSGTLQYLHPNLTSATAMRLAYLAGPVTLTDPGGALGGLHHIAVGRLQLATERTVPGIPARWALTVEFKEV